MSKRIGILTSGGDCAGLNAVIRAVVCRAIDTYGWEVLGIMQGTRGMMERPVAYRRLHAADFSGQVMRMGGTILGTTNKGDPFAFPMPDGSLKDRGEEVTAGYRELGLDAIVVIGGDGSMEILRKLAVRGNWNMVAIPKTIDNDVGLTEVSVGYATAVDVATEALDRLQPTAASHDRVMVLELMGRDAGHIALSAGIAGGADVIIIPEIPYSMDKIADHIREIRRKGRNFALVVCAESARTEGGDKMMAKQSQGQMRYGGVGQYLGAKIAEMTGAETRVTVLGHVQRGGQPSASDRLMACAFGVRAVDLIAAGKFDRMVAWQNRQVVDVPITDAIASYQAVDPNGDLLKTARGLGIYVGNLG
jgi:phosphofructokinase-like protein